MTISNSEIPQRVVVVGAGHGGSYVVAYLRQYGFTGSIQLIGEDQVAPYHRPPLSKAWLKGEVAVGELALKPGAFYSEQNIELSTNQRVESISATARRVTLVNGESLPYDKLILATGAHARTLPIANAHHENVLTLRGLTDAEKLRRLIGPGKRLVIVGGGYIGLECAATARSLGATVVVIEQAPRLLERVASAPVSSFLFDYHTQHGVQFVLGASIAAIEGEASAQAVVLADGQRFPCDAVLVGIGAIPATELAKNAGLACDDGVTVDEDCRTSDPDIFAIGDAAKRPHPLYQRRLRLESVPSAMEQAKRVAAVICQRPPAAPEVPWFWSDQYDLKLQMVGMPFDADSLVVRGSPETGKFGVFHLRDGHVVMVEAINAMPEFMAGKRLVGSHKLVDATRLANPEISMNELLA